MPSFTLGPRMGMAIAVFFAIICFVGGTFYGAQSKLAQSLVNEVAVLVTDSKVANEIREKETANVEKVKEKLREINPIDCASKYSMHELMGLPVDGDENLEP